MNAEEEYAYASLLNVLVSSNAQDIDFYCNGIHVDFAGLYSVYNALMAGDVHVAIDPTLDAQTAAAYDGLKNTFFFRYGAYGNPREPMYHQATLLHESVHALIDLTCAQWRAYNQPQLGLLTYVQDEVVAYIAAALFMHESEEDVANYYTGTSEGIALFMAAAHVATRIKHQAGAVVTDEEAARVASFVEADPTYRGHPLYAVVNG